ncbi:MAG: tRNA threonylcarbamoyladenosine dehydratase [Bacteroidales bacterium]|nr:tRNA threonylcarbamoyladenosine dehydratase [Bacteroidales bacterium]
MSANEWKERTTLLLGNDAVDTLTAKHVLVAGLGGVGAYVAEMLVRVGIGNITIADGDLVKPSNRNRQLLALSSTEGQQKATVMHERLLDINPDVVVNTVPEYLKDDAIEQLVYHNTYDYVADAIDTLSPKLLLIRHTLSRGIPLVSSMGSGGKTEPWLVTVDDIGKSYNCYLAAMLRKRLHRFGIRQGFKVVYSPEPVDKAAHIEIMDEPNKKSTTGTVSYMPAVFGCFMASVIIRDVLGMQDTLLGRDGRVANA